MNKRTSMLVGTGILLALGSAAVWATSASVSWNPAELKPASIAPGELLNTTVSFTNRGLSNINGKELSLEIRGDAAGIVRASAPSFPENIKKGDATSVSVSIHAPSDQTVRVVNGTLVLLKMKLDGKTKEVFGDALPIEITLSPFPLPPEPDQSLDEATVEGVDTNGNGVRDHTERYIGFTYPNSAKLREGLMQDARVYEAILRDSGDKAATRSHAQEQDDDIDCIAYLFHHDWNAIDKATDELKANFILDTAERIRANHNANAQFGGMVGSAGRRGEDEKNACSFNPDQLSN